MRDTIIPIMMYEYNIDYLDSKHELPVTINVLKIWKLVKPLAEAAADAAKTADDNITL
jgi:hypothetical protein